MTANKIIQDEEYF